MMARDETPTAACLASTAFVDGDHPAVRAFAEDAAGGRSPRDAAVALHYAVRDGFPYYPWRVCLEPGGYRGSVLLERPRGDGGHCIDKALLLAASARSLGIPARLHFANVRNHIGTAKMEEVLRTDLLVFHGYVELWLEGRWVATTPAFNRELCEHLGVAPLEFDGRTDAIFQAFDGATRFMEYVEDHGAFDDLPFDKMLAQWTLHYPHIVAAGRWPEPTRRTVADGTG